jgi:magnesium-protoporphyrin IX monomethyl ester (oxidative) cyclase
MKQSRHIERVFLLFPPVRLPAETMKVASSPLGVAYLAAAVHDRAEVRVMDALAASEHQHLMEKGFTWYGSTLAEVRARIEEFKPDLVGVSCLFSSVFPVVREVCRMVKSVDPDIVTITGGAYPSFMAEHCLAEPALDLICIGEGEQTLGEIIERSKNGRSFQDLDGLAYKDGVSVVANPKTSWIEDLDSIPFPARDLLPMDDYRRVGIPHSLSISGAAFAPLITSRGCPARCIYCSSTRLWGNRHRFRSPQNVLDEMGELIQKWGIEEIQFEDDNLTANRERAKALFRGMIERGYQVRFNFPNGVALWTLDQELVDLMKEAGCYEMTLAFESGCQEVLSKIVKKPVKLDKALEIARYIRGQGIRTDAFFILGFPGETKADIQKTLDFADRAATDLAYFFVANPLPGSEMYEMAKERDMLRADFDFEDLTYSRSAWRDEVYGQGWLDKTAHRAFLRYALRSFARRPRLFLRRFFLELLFKRPRYTLAILARIWRRNFGGD